MNQEQSISQAERLQRRMERLYLRPVYQALMFQVLSFTDNLQQRGKEYAVSLLTTAILNKQIGGVIKDLYVQSALLNGNRVYDGLRKYEPREKFRTFGFNEKWTADVTRYFQMHLLEKAVLPISNTTKKFILALLEKATEEGWSIEETVKRLEGSEITKNRAKTIVRTETVRATNFGGMLGAWESKLVMEKRWISAHDVRTRGYDAEDRHSHYSLHGQKIDLLKPFYDSRSGEAIMFPGDPEASGGNTINCRCTLGFIPKRDANGRLIRKPEPVSGLGNSLVDVLGGLLVGLNIGEMFNEN